MTKSELRKLYLEKRNALSQEEREMKSKRIAKKFILQFNPIEKQKVHCFLPIEKFDEIQTGFIINACWERGVEVYIPKMVDGKLISVLYTSETLLVQNKWGIWEPVSNEDAGEHQFDIVVTPLLYCDRQGNRVGYGKGFYDGLFASISPQSNKVGISYFPPSYAISDLRAEDIPLDYLITPDAVLSFAGAL